MLLLGTDKFDTVL